ncbi:hypothetical protein TNCV_2416941 [Trichonephila clavipes]|nr:hypothetical protein TNCV_2416941 [Trichonephila clavipes]
MDESLEAHTNGLAMACLSKDEGSDSLEVGIDLHSVNKGSDRVISVLKGPKDGEEYFERAVVSEEKPLWKVTQYIQGYRAGPHQHASPPFKSYRHLSRPKSSPIGERSRFAHGPPRFSPKFIGARDNTVASETNLVTVSSLPSKGAINCLDTEDIFDKSSSQQAGTPFHSNS